MWKKERKWAEVEEERERRKGGALHIGSIVSVGPLGPPKLLFSFLGLEKVSPPSLAGTSVRQFRSTALWTAIVSPGNILSSPCVTQKLLTNVTELIIV